jgi:hypothetical protein
VTAPREVTYTDELLADRTVHRRYSDGRQEWRSREPSGLVSWRDDRERAGTDEPLGGRIVKRTFADGTVVYGRDVGYGRTLWRGGVLTVNRSSFGGRFGAVLGAVAGAALLGSMVPPPDHLSAAEEDELRSQVDAHASSGGSGADGAGGYDDWDDDDASDDGGDGDFG